MKRKVFAIRSLQQEEADITNKLFEELYQYKTEEVDHTTSATLTIFRSYRESETGLKVFDNATATSFTTSIPFTKIYNQIFNINLQPVGTAIETVVSSFTGSSMDIKINATSTSTKVKFFWKITGTLE